MSFHYRDLVVWNRAIDAVEMIYQLTSKFPTDEKYGLTSQVRRSSVSVAANIAEGHARGSSRDFARFLAMSLGSLAETETHLLIAERLGYTRRSDLIELQRKLDEIGRMIRALQRSVLNRDKELKETTVSSERRSRTSHN